MFSIVLLVVSNTGADVISQMKTVSIQDQKATLTDIGHLNAFADAWSTNQGVNGTAAEKNNMVSGNSIKP